MKLLNPSQFALKTLKMIGHLKLFEVFENQEAAVASFQAPGWDWGPRLTTGVPSQAYKTTSAK